MLLFSIVVILATSCNFCNAFNLPSKNFANRSSDLRALAVEAVSVGLDTKAEGITEQACADAAAEMQRIDVPVPGSVSDSGSVGISFIHWEPDTPKKNTLPLLLVHGRCPHPSSFYSFSPFVDFHF